MTEPVRVLGIDLASKRWRDNGSAIVSFTNRDFDEGGRNRTSYAIFEAVVRCD